MTRIGTRVDRTTLMVMGAGAVSMALGIALSGWPEAQLAAPPPRATSNAPTPAQIPVPAIPDPSEKLVEMEAELARLEQDRLDALAGFRLLAGRAQEAERIEDFEDALARSGLRWEIADEPVQPHPYADLLIGPRETNTGMLGRAESEVLTMDEQAILDAVRSNRPLPAAPVLAAPEMTGGDVRHVIRRYRCGAAGVRGHEIIYSPGHVMLTPREPADAAPENPTDR